MPGPVAAPSPWRLTLRFWMAANVYIALLVAAVVFAWKLSDQPFVRPMLVALSLGPVLFAWWHLTLALPASPGRDVVLLGCATLKAAWFVGIAAMPVWFSSALPGGPAPINSSFAFGAAACGVGFAACLLHHLPARCPGCGWRALVVPLGPVRRPWRVRVRGVSRVASVYRWCAGCGAKWKRPPWFALIPPDGGWDDASGPEDDDAYWRWMTADSRWGRLLRAVPPFRWIGRGTTPCP